MPELLKRIAILTPGWESELDALFDTWIKPRERKPGDDERDEAELEYAARLSGEGY